MAMMPDVNTKQPGTVRPGKRRVGTAEKPCPGVSPEKLVKYPLILSGATDDDHMPFQPHMSFPFVGNPIAQSGRFRTSRNDTKEAEKLQEAMRS